jgi:hypothetical protein
MLENPQKGKNKIFRIIVLGLTLFHFFNCLPADENVSKEDAQSQIYFAAKYKATECGSTSIPEPPLLVFTDQLQRNLELCTIAITRMTCPFDGYPIICLGLYTKQSVPALPWYVNFNELTKTRLKQ